MRKLLILVCAAVFLAAGCNSQSQPAVNQPKTNQTQTSAGAKVDAAVNVLNKSIDFEDAVNMQSDSDIVNEDEAIINSYNGVSNASSY